MKISTIRALSAVLLSIIIASTLIACDTFGNVETESTSQGTGGDLSNKPSTEAVERFDYFSADMDEYLTVDESLYKNVTATLPSYLDGSDEAVTKYVDFLCSQYSVSTGNKIVDRPIEKGDTVALYYEGWLNGEKFQGGSNMDDTKPYMLTIGSGAFIPGFEDALIGIVPNETGKDNLRDLHLIFPENYHSADLAGKAVIFKVYVEYIDELGPSEYTEEFITKTLGYSTSATDVKADFEKYLKDEYLPELKREEIVTVIWSKLTKGAVIKKYPEVEITYFYNSYIDQYEYYKQYYEYYGYKFDSLGDFVIEYMGLPAGADWEAEIRSKCEVDIEQNLIFHAIAQNESITLNDEDYKKAVQYYVDYYTSQGQKVTAEEIESEFGEKVIKEQALWNKVNEFMIDSSEVVYE